MYLAGTLSRAALNLPTPSDPQEEVFQQLRGCTRDVPVPGRTRDYGTRHL